MTDTHAHLYAEQFDADRSEMLQRAIEGNIRKFYLPNIDSTSIDAMLRLESDYPEHCFAMMGLHPCSVHANVKEELRIVERWLGRRTFCAVGEIGIDLHWDTTYFEEQKKAFITQLNWAKELNIPIVIHCRKSMDIVIDIVRQEKTEKLRGIFHCFGGSIEQAEAIIDLDFYLGIGGVVTYKKSGLDKTLEKISLEHVVLETDSPYLAPVPYRGKRNESSYIQHIATKIASIKQISVEELDTITTENARKIFEN